MGEDQRQHLELTRDIAAKFNHDFGVPGFFPQPEAMITPFTASLRLTPAQAYNLLVADLFDRLPVEVIESAEGQKVIRYFCEKLTAPADDRMAGSTQE